MTRRKCLPHIPYGDEIEKKMVELNMTQADLVIKTGLSQSTISNIINEKKTRVQKTCAKLFEHFGWTRQSDQVWVSLTHHKG